jgi:hypothetical protein
MRTTSLVVLAMLVPACNGGDVMPRGGADAATDGAHGDGGSARDGASSADAPASDSPAIDAWSQPDLGTPCTSSGIYTCTSDHTARTRCHAGYIQVDTCAYGNCIGQPTGVDDLCPPDPNATNATMFCGSAGHCVHWWDCHITYQYQYAGSGDWDTDFHMPDGTPIALPHLSQLTSESYAGSGFQPEFTDLVTGEWMHFNHLHLNSEFGGTDGNIGPVQMVSMTDPAHPDHLYPAGYVVGFSGGGTSRTGYLGTDASGNVCSGGHSTAAHFCAVTRVTHPIDYYLPADSAGCTTPLGWPSALWSSISPHAPGYQTCPAVCTGCGVAHF